MELDRKTKTDLKGSSIMNPLEIIQSDLSRIEAILPDSISKPILAISTIKKDNEINMAILKEKTKFFAMNNSKKEE